MKRETSGRATLEKWAGCQPCTEASLRRRDFLRGSLSLLGISLRQYLEAKSVLAAEGALTNSSKAEACILFWLEGGPSHVDTWDPKPNSGFKPISTRVPGIQISELLPRVAKQTDKFAIIRSMHTEEIGHPQGTYYAQTGHRPNPAMLFPSVGSIVTKEKGPRNTVPPYVLEPQWDRERLYEKHFEAAFLGPEYNPMVVPDPSQKDFEIADLRLPKSISVERIEHRRSFLKIWDQFYQEKVGVAERSGLDVFGERPEDDPVAGRQGCLRSFQGIRENKGSLWTRCRRPECLARPAACRGRESFCHYCRLSVQCVGFPQEQ